jgi:ABC-2 type transport system ATP-binding protein
LGQNGAGKTTLLNILTGYLAATEGYAMIGGYDPLLSPEGAKRQLGYLPEHPPLYDEMTVEEYLRFVSRLRGVRKSAVAGHVGEVMEKTGLADMRRRRLSHLSKGYRQRAGMAQALCGAPAALVLDEPTAGLDPKQIVEIRALIRSLAKERTILFSSHILSEVQQLCDHVVILHRGRVKLDTPMDTLHGGGEVTLLCAVAAAEEQVLPLIHGLSGVKRVLAQPSSRPGETDVQITFKGEEQPERALFALCSSQSLPLLRLGRRQDTLEQVFLRAISEE